MHASGKSMAANILERGQYPCHHAGASDVSENNEE
jgi:dephospho-CoA kinase